MQENPPSQARRPTRLIVIVIIVLIAAGLLFFLFGSSLLTFSNSAQAQVITDLSITDGGYGVLTVTVKNTGGLAVTGLSTPALAFGGLSTPICSLPSGWYPDPFQTPITSGQTSTIKCVLSSVSPGQTLPVSVSVMFSDGQVRTLQTTAISHVSQAPNAPLAISSTLTQGAQSQSTLTATLENDAFAPIVFISYPLYGYAPFCSSAWNPEPTQITPLSPGGKTSLKCTSYSSPYSSYLGQSFTLIVQYSTNQVQVVTFSPISISNTAQFQVSADLVVPGGTGTGTLAVSVTNSGSVAITGISMSGLCTSITFTPTPSTSAPLAPGSGASGSCSTSSSVTAGQAYSFTLTVMFANGQTQTQIVSVTAH